MVSRFQASYDGSFFFSIDFIVQRALHKIPGLFLGVKRFSRLTRGARKVDIISLHVFSVHISYCAKMLPKADTEAIIQ